MRYVLISEVVWWCLSFLLAFAVVYPYYPDLIVKTPFLIPNIVMVIVTIQCLRHIFFFRQSLLGNSGWMIYFIPVIVVPLVVYVIRHFNAMALFFDDTRWIHSFSYLLSVSEKSKLAKYIKTQFTFMAVATVVSGAGLSIRFMVASWRRMNKRKLL